jgi:oxygen-independent coproporphyrinogen III oxidase
MRRMSEHGLAAARGYAFTSDDIMRNFTIERLMCDLAFPAQELRERFGQDAAPILAQAEALMAGEKDGFIQPDAGGGFRVTERGRMFVRTICAHFDAHERPSEAQYSSGA